MARHHNPLTLATLGYIGYGLATAGWMVYVIVLIGSIGNIGGPAINGVMSRIVPPNAQGELQGAMTGSQAREFIGPLILPSVFRYATQDGVAPVWSGAPFFLAAKPSGP